MAAVMAAYGASCSLPFTPVKVALTEHIPATQATAGTGVHAPFSDLETPLNALKSGGIGHSWRLRK